MPSSSKRPQPQDAFNLSGTTAIVTGAGSGIGMSSARVLAAAGANVVCADRNPDSAAETAEVIENDGGRAESATVDVSRRDDVEEVVRRTVATHGRLDAMCNIAGAIRHGAVLDLTEEDLDWSLGVNLKGVVFGSQAAARVMVEQGHGSIINMSSGTIDAMTLNVAGYAMAKAAVVQLTRSLALEVGKRGVRVNALAPGFVVTALTGAHQRGASRSADSRDPRLAEMAQAAALGRVGQPIDVGLTVLFLASEASSFITGQVLRPNGGVVMPW